MFYKVKKVEHLKGGGKMHRFKEFSERFKEFSERLKEFPERLKEFPE